MMMALQQFQPPSLPSTSSVSISPTSPQTLSSLLRNNYYYFVQLRGISLNQKNNSFRRRKRISIPGLVFVGKEDTQLSVPSPEAVQDDDDEDEEEEEEDPTPDDLEYVSQIKRVLELLRKNRDMIFSEVKLTVLIEDPREVERRRLLGIDDSEAPTRDDLATALEQINEGKVPKNRVALRMLAEEMIQWPNLEGLLILTTASNDTKSSIFHHLRLKHRRKPVGNPYTQKPQTLVLILKSLLRDSKLIGIPLLILRMRMTLMIRMCLQLWDMEHCT